MDRETWIQLSYSAASPTVPRSIVGWTSPAVNSLQRQEKGLATSCVPPSMSPCVIGHSQHSPPMRKQSQGKARVPQWPWPTDIHPLGLQSP